MLNHHFGVWNEAAATLLGPLWQNVQFRYVIYEYQAAV